MINHGNYNRQPVDVSVSAVWVHGGLGKRRVEPDQCPTVRTNDPVSGVWQYRCNKPAVGTSYRDSRHQLLSYADLVAAGSQLGQQCCGMLWAVGLQLDFDLGVAHPDLPGGAFVVDRVDVGLVVGDDIDQPL